MEAICTSVEAYFKQTEGSSNKRQYNSSRQWRDETNEQRQVVCRRGECKNAVPLNKSHIRSNRKKTLCITDNAALPDANYRNLCFVILETRFTFSVFCVCLFIYF